MSTLLVKGIDPASQRYSTTCLRCRAHFAFAGNEITRVLDGSTARCSIPCPDCNGRAQWLEHQTLPAPLKEPAA